MDQGGAHPQVLRSDRFLFPGVIARAPEEVSVPLPCMRALVSYRASKTTCIIIKLEHRPVPRAGRTIGRSQRRRQFATSSLKLAAQYESTPCARARADLAVIIS